MATKTAITIGNATRALYNSDPNGNGLTLLLEYALGLNPSNTNTLGLPTPGLAGSYLTLTYTKNKAATDLTVFAEVSDDLLTWLSTGADVEPRWQVIDCTTFETITARDLIIASPSAPRRFMRLKVTQP